MNINSKTRTNSGEAIITTLIFGSIGLVLLFFVQERMKSNLTLQSKVTRTSQLELITISALDSARTMLQAKNEDDEALFLFDAITPEPVAGVKLKLTSISLLKPNLDSFSFIKSSATTISTTANSSNPVTFTFKGCNLYGQQFTQPFFGKNAAYAPIENCKDPVTTTVKLLKRAGTPTYSSAAELKRDVTNNMYHLDAVSTSPDTKLKYSMKAKAIVAVTGCEYTSYDVYQCALTGYANGNPNSEMYKWNETDICEKQRGSLNIGFTSPIVQQIKNSPQCTSSERFFTDPTYPYISKLCLDMLQRTAAKSGPLRMFIRQIPTCFTKLTSDLTAEPQYKCNIIEGNELKIISDPTKYINSGLFYKNDPTKELKILPSRYVGKTDTKHDVNADTIGFTFYTWHPTYKPHHFTPYVAHNTRDRKGRTQAHALFPDGYEQDPKEIYELNYYPLLSPALLIGAEPKLPRANYNGTLNKGGWVYQNKVTIHNASLRSCHVSISRIPGLAPGVRNTGCFDQDTMIQTVSGLVAIKDITMGTRVINPVTGKEAYVYKVVAGPESKDMFELTVNGRTVKLTEEHPILLKSGITTASKVKKGDLIKDESDKFAKIQNVKKVKPDPDQQVWNILISSDSNDEKDHYILANGIVSGDLYLQNKLSGSKK